MAMLHIPDKYAMERGGWKTDAVIKNVYTHTFSEQRIEVDNIIDTFFEECLGINATQKNKPLNNQWFYNAGKGT